MRRYFIVILALLLGVGGCEKEQTLKKNQYYVLWITARVVDEAGEPIQGIYVYPEGAKFPGREGYTDYKGEMGGNTHIDPYKSVKIVFEDVDGEYNRGTWATRVVDISSLLTPPQESDSNGFLGSSFIELGDIELMQVDFADN